MDRSGGKNRVQVLALLLLSACGTAVMGNDGSAVDAAFDAVSDAGGSEVTLPTFEPMPLPSSMQRPGDPDAGYRALVNNGYVSCGIPISAYRMVAGAAPEIARLPGREGSNTELPYAFTAFRTRSGVEVVAPNCLSCHAGYLNNQLVVGLGDSTADFTIDTGAVARIARGFVTDPTELAEFDRWSERTVTIAPYIRTRTLGANPADNLAAVLFARRDPRTLAWSRTWLLEPPPNEPVPVDTPPWWRMRKKNTMFYTGSGRGDHARIMMTASTLCTDTVEEARIIDGYFNDVRAYIASIRPPRWPYGVDMALAERGRAVFERTCSSCHGTYGERESFPNLVVSVAQVGTDPLLATGTTQFAQRFVQWFNGSFYGEIARLEPVQGYAAPPLDGIWATAPFLHNGSVPTLRALLDSRTRPRYWTRTFRSTDIDRTNVGWRFTALETGHEGVADRMQRARIYDTTLPGYGNQGHTFGDSLSEEDRDAVIEYLKTL